MFSSKVAAFRIKPWICQSCRISSTTLQQQTPKRRQSQKLPELPARTRFAPSPTGNLHLGSLRTALFNYLLARATGGQFILRIEDTDTKRTVPGAEERLYEDLQWAGLDWDEGPLKGGQYGPYRQSERTALYQSHAQTLLKSQTAYRCFCSSERLKEVAKHQNQYDGACRLISKDQSEERAANGDKHVVRLQTPGKLPSFHDLVYGNIGKKSATGLPTINKSAYEDLILVKSDGLPTYHLANVVDDHQMKITHVIRAVEWMSSTPKHVLLYKAFGWDPPTFAHVGLLQDSQHQKLSKRDMESVGLDVRGYQKQGIFPEALLNYAALFGWSHSGASDVMNLEDLVRSFDLKFTKGNTVVMPEKLKYFQKQYAVKSIDERGPVFDSIVQHISSLIQEYLNLYPNVRLLDEADLTDRIVAMLDACKYNYFTPVEFYQKYFSYFQKLEQEDYSSLTRTIRQTTRRSYGRMVAPEKRNHDYVLRCGRDVSRATLLEIAQSQLGLINRRLLELPPQDWNEDHLSKFVGLIIDESSSAPVLLAASRDEHKKVLFHFMRWVLTAGWSGPPIARTMAILGREVSLTRLAEIPTVIAAINAELLEQTELTASAIAETR